MTKEIVDSHEKNSSLLKWLRGLVDKLLTQPGCVLKSEDGDFARKLVAILKGGREVVASVTPKNDSKEEGILSKNGKLIYFVRKNVTTIWNTVSVVNHVKEIEIPARKIDWRDIKIF